MNKYILKKSYAEMHITKVKNEGIVLLDVEDIQRVEDISWSIKDSLKKDVGYVAGKLNGKLVKLHRFIMNAEKNEIVDHIDRNELNNRKNNLRIVSSSQNNLNASFSKNNTSGRTGVRLQERRGNRSASWVAQYTVEGTKKTKSFSIEIYGHERAYKLAVKFRRKAEEKYSITTARTCND